MQKGLLSVVAGNTPDIRGVGVERLLRLSPRAVLLAVSIQGHETGYLVVQRLLLDLRQMLGGEAAQHLLGSPPEGRRTSRREGC
ncbi:hypothetical protein [Streptomyces sp. NPDC057438]|uniref:hypothetical protein n=1 Tax=Streptomyces sp. NPDC057438 TaxID=3346133 RepID=UPI0036787FDB